VEILIHQPKTVSEHLRINIAKPKVEKSVLLVFIVEKSVVDDYFFKLITLQLGKSCFVDVHYGLTLGSLSVLEVEPVIFVSERIKCELVVDSTVLVNLVFDFALAY